MSNKSTLVTFFETGDVPSAAQFADLINSQVNLFETGDQSMAGTLVATQFVAPQVSATNVNVTGTLSANTLAVNNLSITNLSITGAFSAATINANSGFIVTLSAANLNASAAIITTLSASNGYFNSDVTVSGNVGIAGTLSSQRISTTGNVSASDGNFTGAIIRSVSVVSAAGTTQATGAVLGRNGVIRLKGIVDGTTTGFTLLANLAGNQQTIWVEENTSCNLWPCVGGQINALSSNAAFAMTGNTQYIVTHIKASGYSVK